MQLTPFRVFLIASAHAYIGHAYLTKVTHSHTPPNHPTNSKRSQKHTRTHHQTQTTFKKLTVRCVISFLQANIYIPTISHPKPGVVSELKLGARYFCVDAGNQFSIVFMGEFIARRITFGGEFSVYFYFCLTGGSATGFRRFNTTMTWNIRMVCICVLIRDSTSFSSMYLREYGAKCRSSLRHTVC